jgi:hypothetical protein
MRDGSKAAVLYDIVLPEILLEHAEHRANLLHVLACLINGLGRARIGVVQVGHRLFELSGHYARELFGRRLSLFQPIRHVKPFNELGES